MLRLICLCLLVLAAPAFGADSPFTPRPLFAQAGPHAARGAVVWVPGTYGRDQPGRPDPPDLVGRFAGRGLDVFQFLRPRGNDPLAGGAETLAGGLTELRARGYRWIVVAEHSRGAWIALTAMARRGSADAIVVVSVGAHGTHPERQAQAREDWAALWGSPRPGPTRVVLVQLSDDPYDTDPRWRLDLATAQAARAGLSLLPIFQPPEPRGHVGVYEPAFDEHLGPAIADFADPGR